jgi:hypothetical protein
MPEDYDRSGQILGDALRQHYFGIIIGFSLMILAVGLGIAQVRRQ